MCQKADCKHGSKGETMGIEQTPETEPEVEQTPEVKQSVVTSLPPGIEYVTMIVYDVDAGDSHDHIKIAKSLVEDPDFFDHSGRLNVKRGRSYSLRPRSDRPEIRVLRNLRASYMSITTKPSGLMSTVIAKTDHLIETVGELFGKLRYVIINTKEDMEKMLGNNKAQYADVGLQVLEYTCLGEIAEALGVYSDIRLDGIDV